jgi:thioredoxin
MKTLSHISAIAFMTLAMLTSCENAGAHNDSKNKTTDTKHAIELTTEQFMTMVYDVRNNDTRYLGNKPAIVDFTATWCGPCRSIAPILEELAKEYKDQIVIYKVDVDQCRELAEAFGISSIPAVLYIPLDGEPSMTIGARSKAKFQQEIDRILLGK